MPRVWKPEDDIDGAFKKAKEQVSLLTIYCSFPYTNAATDSGPYSTLLRD